MTESGKSRIVGLNHIALEVGDIEEALAFYGRLFTFELRGKSDSMAFIDLGACLSIRRISLYTEGRVRFCPWT